MKNDLKYYQLVADIYDHTIMKRHTNALQFITQELICKKVNLFQGYQHLSPGFVKTCYEYL